MNGYRRVLVLILALILFAISAIGEETKSAEVLSSLALPTWTETDLVYDGALLIEEHAHDLNGKPTENAQGYADAYYAYDDEGSLVSERFYGADGKPINTDRGYASADYTYFMTAITTCIC